MQTPVPIQLPPQSSSPSAQDSIQVFVRVRPQRNAQQSSVQFTDTEIRLDRHQFAFDRIFSPASTQNEIFNSVGNKLLDNVLDGYNSCVFVYGQTGSGKTHTMIGDNNGLMQQSFRELFSRINRLKNAECLVTCTYFELYNEQIMDLLEPKKQKKLNIRHDVKKGVFVENLSQETALDVDKLMEVLYSGMKNRHIGQTQMNRESSRSHSVFSISLSCKIQEDGKKVLKTPKLHFVDLAGSERQKMTMASGDRLKQAGNINKSLTTLGMVINALTSERPRSHIPYRDSKLTCLLRDSLGGNAKTIIIATISSSVLSFQQTLSTLNFANRAKMVKVTALINEQSLSSNIEVYKDEIRKLKAEIMKLKHSDRGRAPINIIHTPSRSQDFLMPIGMSTSHFSTNNQAASSSAMATPDYQKHFEQINRKIEAISDQLSQGVTSPTLQSMLEALKNQQNCQGRGKNASLNQQNSIMDLQNDGNQNQNQMENQKQQIGNEFSEYLSSNYQLLSQIHKKINDYVEIKEDLRNAALNKKLALEQMMTPSKFEREQYEDLIQQRQAEIRRLQFKISQVEVQQSKSTLEKRQLERKLEHLTQKQKGDQVQAIEEVQSRISHFKQIAQKSQQALELERINSQKSQQILTKTLKLNNELQQRLKQTKQLYLYSQEKYQNEKFTSQQLTSKIELLEQQIAHLRKTLAQHKQQKKQQQNKIESLQLALQDSEIKQQQLRNTLNEMEQTAEYNKKIINDMSMRQLALNTEIRLQKQDIDALTQDKKMVSQELEDYRKTSMKQSQNQILRISQLSQQLQVSRQQNSTLTDQLTSLQKVLQTTKIQSEQAISLQRQATTALNQQVIDKTQQVQTIKNTLHQLDCEFARYKAESQSQLKTNQVNFQTKRIQLEMFQAQAQTQKQQSQNLINQLTIQSQSISLDNIQLTTKLAQQQDTNKQLKQAVSSLEATVSQSQHIRDQNQQLKRSYKQIVKQNYRLKGKYMQPPQNEQLAKEKNQELIAKVEYYEEKFRLMSIEYQKVIDVVKRLKEKQLQQGKKIHYFEESTRVSAMAQMHGELQTQDDQIVMIRELKQENRELKAKIDNIQSNLGQHQRSRENYDSQNNNFSNSTALRQEKFRAKLQSLMKKWDGFNQQDTSGNTAKNLGKPSQHSTEQLMDLCQTMIQENAVKFETIAKGIRREQKLKSQNHFILKENIYLKQKLEAIEENEKLKQAEKGMQFLASARKGKTSLSKERPRKIVKVD